MTPTLQDSLTRYWGDWLAIRHFLSPSAQCVVLSAMVAETSAGLTLEILFDVSSIGEVGSADIIMAVAPRKVDAPMLFALQALCQAVFWGNDSEIAHIEVMSLNTHERNQLERPIQFFKAAKYHLRTPAISDDRETPVTGVYQLLKIGSRLVKEKGPGRFWDETRSALENFDSWLRALLIKHCADLWLLEDEYEVALQGYQAALLQMNQLEGASREYAVWRDSLDLSVGACIRAIQGKSAAAKYLGSLFKESNISRRPLLHVNGIYDLLNSAENLDRDVHNLHGTTLIQNRLILPSGFRELGLLNWLQDDTSKGLRWMLSDLRSCVAAGAFTEAHRSTYWLARIALEDRKAGEQSIRTSLLALVATASPKLFQRIKFDPIAVAAALSVEFLEEARNLANRYAGCRTDRWQVLIEFYLRIFDTVRGSHPALALIMWKQIIVVAKSSAVSLDQGSDLGGSCTKALKMMAESWPAGRNNVKVAVVVAFLRMHQRAKGFWRDWSDPIEMIARYADVLSGRTTAKIVGLLLEDLGNLELQRHWPIPHAIMQFLWMDGVIEKLEGSLFDRVVEIVTAQQATEDPARLLVWLARIRPRLNDDVIIEWVNRLKDGVFLQATENSTHADICIRALMSLEDILTEADRTRLLEIVTDPLHVVVNGRHRPLVFLSTPEYVRHILTSERLYPVRGNPLLVRLENNLRGLWQKAAEGSDVFAPFSFADHVEPDRYSAYQWAAVTMLLSKYLGHDIGHDHPLFQVSDYILAIPALNAVLESGGHIPAATTAHVVESLIQRLDQRSSAETLPIAVRMVTLLRPPDDDRLLNALAQRAIGMGPGPSDGILFHFMISRPATFHLEKEAIDDYYKRLQSVDHRDLFWQLGPLVTAVFAQYAPKNLD